MLENGIKKKLHTFADLKSADFRDKLYLYGKKFSDC